MSRHVVKVLFLVALPLIDAAINDYYTPENQQYHIQTDEGDERYFRYQTLSGQYRKERRLEDGTVVGTYAWIDGNGFLRQNDYVADGGGYRIRKSKQLYVGKDVPINEAMKFAKKSYSAPGTSPTDFKLIHSNNAGISRKSQQSPLNQIPRVSVSKHGYPLERADYLTYSTQRPPSSSTFYKTSTPSSYYDRYVSASTQRPVYRNDLRFQYSNDLENVVAENGFRYYIPRAYHEEETVPYQERTGSFGYVDPFGIRRVVYYNTAPGTGFQHKKHNSYVGLNTAPYDSTSY